MSPSPPWKPTKEQIAAAKDRSIPDVLAPGLRVLFCGINPSLYSAAVGHHFARPGNRFWPTLHLSGFTTRRLSPFEDRELLKDRLGISNLVDRATARADELAESELVAGGRNLTEKVGRASPKVVAFLGLTAYRSAFGRPRAAVGCQEDRIRETTLWVLPNPSGLNAHYQLADLAELFRTLLKTVNEA